jgi:hypothetical protein
VLPAPAANPVRLATVTPLQSVSPGTMVTPEAETTYMHVSILSLQYLSAISPCFASKWTTYMSGNQFTGFLREVVCCTWCGTW